MLARFSAVILLLAVPLACAAGEPPEQLLPATTQVYFRWDGIGPHRSAYEKTALGKMLAGDTGKLLVSAFDQLQDFAANNLTGQQLLQGLPPEQLQQIQAAVTDAPKLLTLLGQHGIVIGLEVRELQPPSAQALIIVPDAGAEASRLFSTLRLAAGLLNAAPQQLKVDGRTVDHIAAGPVHLGWWLDGTHAVLMVGTDHPEAVIKRLHDPRPRLTEAPLFHKLRDFKQFETGARGFVDLAALVHLARGRGKEVSKLISELGLDGLKSWRYYSGFDGDVERSLSELDAPGPRTGLLRVIQPHPFKLHELPPMPADTVSWSATNFDAGALYDSVLQAVEGIAGIVYPESVPLVKGFVGQIDVVLGINLRADLLGALGDKFVHYTSPGEGIFTFGQTYVFKVKEAKKLEASLEQVTKALAKLTGTDVNIKRVVYHDVVLHEVHVRQPGFFLVPTFAIHNGWLAVSYFPQPIQGFVLRAKGKLAAWEPEGRVKQMLAQFPQEFVSVSISDPRPTVRTLLTLAPLIAGGIKSAFPDAKFEIGSIPNGLEATQHLFPNVSVVSDDGTVLRSETRASLALPIDINGLDAYALAIAFTFAVRVF
jgi:hypothetical protein